MCVAVGRIVVTNRAPVGSRLKMGENDMVTRERDMRDLEGAIDMSEP